MCRCDPVPFGDTATLTMSYSPSDLPGYEKLMLDPWSEGIIEVLDGTQTVISESDTSELWPVPSTPDPCTVTVKGVTASVLQGVLYLQFTPDGSSSPGTTYNGNSVSVTVVRVDEVVKAGTVLNGPFYIAWPDETFQLQAKPYHGTAPWPSGKPNWELVNPPGPATITPPSGSATVTLSDFDVPGEYVVKATCGASDTGFAVTVGAVDAQLDSGFLDFFRNTSYELPLTVIPSSGAEFLSVSVSGDDDVHWTVYFNELPCRIDLTNLIQESSLVGWVDEVELSVSAGVGEIEDDWHWVKKLRLKKRLDAFWDDMKEDGIDELNNLVSPADEIRDYAIEQLQNVSDYDDEDVLHTLSPTVIASVGNSVYVAVNGAWADFVNTFIWSGVPTEALHEKVVRESWQWDWDVNFTLNLSGGTISLSPKWQHLWQWMDSVNQYGLDGPVLNVESVLFDSTIEADGFTATGRIRPRWDVSIQYSHDEGHVDFATMFTCEILLGARP
jgi:hypothetical protein